MSSITAYGIKATRAATKQDETLVGKVTTYSSKKELWMLIQGVHQGELVEGLDIDCLTATDSTLELAKQRAQTLKQLGTIEDFEVRTFSVRQQ